MSRHRRWGVGRSLLRPLLVVPTVLVLLIVSAAVVWSKRANDEAAACTPAAGGCVGAQLPSSVSSIAAPTQTPASPPASSSAPRASAGSSPALRATDAAPKQRSCSTPKSCGFPHAGNTGPRTKPSIRKTGDISIRKNGTVVNGWDLQGSLDIYADNVTVTNCRIASRNWWAVNLRPGHTGLKVTRCRITDSPGKGPDNGGSNYAVSNMSDGSIEVGWNDISGFGNVLSMGHGTIHDNYVHDLSAFVTDSGEWQHTDAVISNGSDSGGLVVRHNTLLNETPIDKGSTAAVGLFADNGPVRNTTVQDNWMAGGAYVLYGGSEGGTNIKIIDNVFSTQFHPKGGIYGFVTAWDHDGTGNVWSGNRTSNGEPVTPPTS